MWFWFFLSSLFINIFLLTYLRWLLSSLGRMNEDISSLNNIILNFTAHVKSIYELEMFYGDETLKALLEHGNELSKRLEGLDLLINLESTEEQNADDGLFNPAQSTQVEGPE